MIRELVPPDTGLAFAAMNELRPQLGDQAEFARRVDEVQRPEGYRLVAAFDGCRKQAVAAAGFRVANSLSCGRYLYVDDLSTLASERRRGHGGRLLAWLRDEGRRLGCDQIHLDSGLGPDRADAHRLYLNDVYALGAMAFEVLSGRRARAGTPPVEVAHRIANTPPPELREAWPDAPAAAEALRADMDADPARRPRSAGALVARLTAALAEGATLGERTLPLGLGAGRVSSGLRPAAPRLLVPRSPARRPPMARRPRSTSASPFSHRSPGLERGSRRSRSSRRSP